MLNEGNIKEIISEISARYGYDFSQYSASSLHRRISRIYGLERFSNFSQFKEKLSRDPHYFEYFLREVTVNVTEMFRDPSFYRTLTEEVFPELNKFPFIRIWSAGCSTGEEVYSLAILLKEHKMLDKCRLYATDINPKVLEVAKHGVIPLSSMKKYSVNYMQAGGKEEFSKYYRIVSDQAVLDKELGRKIVFSVHNLVSDQSFNEFHLIVCRNVLIYFEKELQVRVVRLFSASLADNGFLALGSKESLRFSDIDNVYSSLSKADKIWRKGALPG
jgi:chemotaxis protein methyltransferase CheR